MKRILAENVWEVEIRKQIDGARVGKIVKIDENGQVFVDFLDNTQGPVAARFTNSLKSQIVNQTFLKDQEVLLIFENNDAELPIIIDTLNSIVDEQSQFTTTSLDAGKPEYVMVDDKRIQIEGQDEVVLRCGKATITLRRNGRVIIRGTYVESRSKGTNRIKGGSVLIN
jgi:hypothetical protein